MKRKKSKQQAIYRAVPPDAARVLAFELCRRRQACGVSLDDVAAHTRIPKHYLQAIESGDFEKLPGGIYLRNYLKLYARYFQFDESVVQKAFSPAAAAVTAEIPHNLFPKQIKGGTEQNLQLRGNLPKFGELLLYMFLPKTDRDIFIGDMEEEVATITQRIGPAAAYIYAYKEIFKTLRDFHR